MPDEVTISQRHIWYSAAECAAMLDATQHGKEWRAACPAHGGTNRQSLRITEERDGSGHPLTLMHCFAHKCPIEAICQAMGIRVRQLFCTHPEYGRATRRAPRTQSPRIERVRTQATPATPDEIAQLLLEEMIISDPAWVQTCAPARVKLWELAADPYARVAFTTALVTAHVNPTRFWQQLAEEQRRGSELHE